MSLWSIFYLNLDRKSIDKGVDKNYMKKVGRPLKYICEEDRLDAIRQNKRKYINTRRRRERDLKRKNKELISCNKSMNNSFYRDSLVQMNKGKAYNIFFTGTFDKIRYGYNRVTINTIKNLTKRFLNKLYKNQSIKNHFVTYEKQSEGDWHSHIVLEFVNDNVLDLDGYLKNLWMHGQTSTQFLLSEPDVIIVLEYMVKNIEANINNVECLSWDYNFEPSAEVGGNINEEAISDVIPKGIIFNCNNFVVITTFIDILLSAVNAFNPISNGVIIDYIVFNIYLIEIFIKEHLV